MFLNNQQVTEKIKMEIKKFLDTNDNENSTTQTLWDAVKAVLREKFIEIQSYLKKQEKHQIDNLNLYLKEPKKKKNKNNQQKERNHKDQSRKKQQEIKEKIVKTNKTKSWFFEKIKLTNLQTDSSRKKNQINKIRNEKGEVTTDNAEIQRNISDYYEQLYGNKMDNLEEMERFLEKSKTEPARNGNYEQPNYKH